MEQAFAVVAVHSLGEKFAPPFTQMPEPPAILWPELFFELSPQALRERRALSPRGDRDSERPAMHHRRIIEIAKRRNVHDIAQHSSLYRFLEYLFV